MSDDDKRSPDDAITIEEVSALLGPPRRTIYEKIQKDDDFPKPFKVGKRLFWVRADILAYRAKKLAEFKERTKVKPEYTREQRLRDIAFARAFREIHKRRPGK